MRRRWLVLAALVLGLAAGWFVYDSYRVALAVVAAGDLALGERLTKDSVKVTSVHPGSAPPGAGYSYVLFGKSAAVPLGGDVVSLGYPVTAQGDGVSCSTGVTVTEGLISNRTSYKGLQYLQTDAAINHGRSGGVSLDLTGALIGLPTASLDPATSDNVGYLISADSARPIVDDWISRHREGTLAPVKPAPAEPRLVYTRPRMTCGSERGYGLVDVVPF